MKPATSIQRVDVCVGKAGVLAGHLGYAKQGQREFSTFAYDTQWLASPSRFEVSPDLPLVAGFQARRAPSKADSIFHLALADTAPDAWGRRVIARAHAKERKNNPNLAALTELDYLTAVDDFSRVGALRLRDAKGIFLRTFEDGKRTTPPHTGPGPHSLPVGSIDVAGLAGRRPVVHRDSRHHSLQVRQPHCRRARAVAPHAVQPAHHQRGRSFAKPWFSL
jgi:hypothetical protein